MSGTELMAALLVGAGLAFLGVGVLVRFRRRTETLADILDLPYGERDVPIEAVTESHAAFVEDTIGFAGRMVDQVDTKGSLRTLLERARVPMRPGEFVLVAVCAGIVAGVFLAAITENWIIGVVAGLLVPVAALGVLKMRITRRRKALEAQLPEALSLIASSLSAGHTFLRSIQMMCEEAEPPISEEFARVVAETRLGDPVVDALERMAIRLEITDLTWVVQAIRIQQTVGGKLADLLHTLAEFIRAREEIRREVDVLTAEGRISAWVLGAMPIGLLLVIQVSNPDYLEPMFRGWGLVVLGLCGVSIAAGGFLLISAITARSRLASGDPAEYLRSLEDEEGPTDAFEQMLEEPFFTRVVRPLGGGAMRSIASLTPRNYLEKIHKQLTQAGLSNTVRAEELVTAQILAAAAGLVVAILYVVLGEPNPRYGVLALVLGPAVGALAPSSWLSRKMQERKDAIRKDLPDTLDLLSISVEAGMGFEGALDVVCTHFHSPLAEEFSRTLKEMELGLARREALHNLKRRTEVPELSNFVLTLTQADALGMPIGRILKTQAAEMRTKRRQWAREKAGKLPVKILFPLVLFIFPPTFIIILGPAASEIGRAF